MTKGRPVWLVFEDELSGAILRRLVSEVRPQLAVDRAIVTHGNARLLAGVAKYVGMSKAGYPHIVLTDLDRIPCPPALLDKWQVPTLPGLMLFRIAVREVESWVMADRSGFATLVGIPLSKVPIAPDTLEDPKQTLLNLVLRSRRTALKRDMLPTQGSVAPIGPFYNEILGRFVKDDWNISEAAKRSKSLNKALLRLGSF